MSILKNIIANAMFTIRTNNISCWRENQSCGKRKRKREKLINFVFMGRALSQLEKFFGVLKSLFPAETAFFFFIRSHLLSIYQKSCSNMQLKIFFEHAISDYFPLRCLNKRRESIFVALGPNGKLD